MKAILFASTDEKRAIVGEIDLDRSHWDYEDPPYEIVLGTRAFQLWEDGEADGDGVPYREVSGVLVVPESALRRPE